MAITKEKYIEFRCKHIDPNLTSSFECRKELGGPSINTLLAHDFTKAPYKDTRYCTACKTLWEITIPSMDGIPVFKPIRETVDYVEPIDVFNRVIVIHSAENKDG